MPAGTTGKVVSTFAGSAQCSGGENQFVIVLAVRPQCDVRVTVQAPGLSIPVTADPGEVTVLDSDDATINPDNIVDVEGFSLTTVSDSVTLAPGTYTVRAQVNTNDSDADADDNVAFVVAEYILTATVALNDAPTL